VKLTADKEVFSSNVDKSETMAFGIGDASVVIEILRNRLYENKIQTLVQEYCCNARDAHREIGQKQNIEVHFPTQDNKVFSVRDYGPGISPDRMANVFVLYGASTKRVNNHQTGGFGIGAKSAWSYVDSFTIDTYIDGIHRTYIAETGSDSNGCVNKMHEGPTKEVNGTKISIQVRQGDIQGFARAIIRCSMFWSDEEYPTFKNDFSYRGGLDESKKYGRIRFMNTNLSGIDCNKFTGNGNVQIIVDGVPYPMPRVEVQELRDLQGKVGTSNLNVFVPNGLVQVSASREKIDNSDTSKAAVKQIFKAALSSFESAFNVWDSEITDSKTMMAALQKSAGFHLTSKTNIDYMALVHGRYVLMTELNDGDKDTNNGVDTVLFATNSITRNSIARDAIDLNSEHRYYMIKRGAVKLISIQDWLYQNRNTPHIQLVSIMAHKNTKFEYDDEGITKHYWKKKRDDKLSADLIASLQRLGFKDIETIIPKEVATPAQKASRKGIKVGGTIYADGDNSTRLEIKNLKKSNPKDVWIYFSGKSSDSSYKSYEEMADELKNLGEIKRYFRVTESNLKHVKDNQDFVEYDEFMKSWIPSNELIVRHAIKNHHNQIKNLANCVAGELDNSNYAVYLAANKIANSEYCGSNWKIASIIQKTQVYKDTTAELNMFCEFVRKHIPFVSMTCNHDHKIKYLAWALDEAEKAGHNLSTLKYLV
jgi:hypothetical protein